ncbi:MAG: ABC transporter ATP-binding protein [Pseudonocardia sp.]|uniref:ABC transporter ATP-binding protein n=1 Tax=unclassified Pseudonocardia TaxID=2619320 RepID=UPI00086B12B5|nr:MULTISPECIES: ABC transporter ATP-binding protein [unclassified Pseudonocardia]MBN9109391.1 ABC transporter ATP-binding protein [Pseudonocardia sp.]ODU29962.1 MAG: ABC transporter ATP-binding protein [Pseudonocardia sp. SCN 72-51]ODV08101.1 MAG: ABC transporter ATP-binding protein [Pseudonocardia sp. SCN 73-27]
MSTETASAPEATAPDKHAALRLDAVIAGYGRTTVLRDVNVTVPAGKIVALLGANGAGKTTLLRIASGMLRPTAGTVHLGGDDVTRTPPHQRVRKGLCLIPEGRGIFRDLTVTDNLRLFTPPWEGGERRADAVDRALDVFPALQTRRGHLAGHLSGGQQQMLALARCYLANPRVIMLDEVSLGLAPKVVDEIFESLRTLATTGLTLLLVEQYVNRVLPMADKVVLLDRGQVVYDGDATDLDEETVLGGYLGTG